MPETEFRKGLGTAVCLTELFYNSPSLPLSVGLPEFVLFYLHLCLFTTFLKRRDLERLDSGFVVPPSQIC